MDVEEENPANSGPEGLDASRAVSAVEAADLATIAKPHDEQMEGDRDVGIAEECAEPYIEKANTAAGDLSQAEEDSAMQPANEVGIAIQMDQDGAQPDAAQQAEPAPVDQPLDLAIGQAHFIKAADSQRVVWARVKGFPHWPAQTMTEKEAAVRMEHVHRPSPLSQPVMFFGTLEISWIAPQEVASWADGVKANYFKKNRTRRNYLKSVEQAHMFLAPGPKRRKAPEGWWKKAINPPKPKSKETVLEIGALGRTTQAAKPGASKGAKGGSKVANGLGVHPNSKVAKRVQRPVKRIDGADEDELTALLGEGEADLTAAPKRRGSAPKPPHYEALRRNLWVSRARPKRMPKDDIPVCGCTPPVAAVPLARPSLAPAPSAAIILQPSDAVRAPADAAVPGSAPAQLASAACAPPGGTLAEPAAPENADAPIPPHAPEPPANGIAAEAGADEALAPIAVPEASAVLVPLEAVATAAKAAMPERTECGENCLNRLSYIHCDPKQCPCGEYCSNRPFHLLPIPKTELFLTENRGWGVKAAEPIPRGTFIVEYAGEVIDDQECKRRMAHAKETGLQHFYMMELAPGLIIDARNKGNMARFINSSCSPNCESQKWHDAATGEIRIGIFAADDIEPGTELAYDYQFQHAGLAQDAGAYRCMCGAANCRGTMDTQPHRFKDFGKRLEVFWDGDSVYYRGTVTSYSATTGKHTILYDDNDVERVDLKMVRHRWLDESAPMKRSPLRAVFAQNGMLALEPLDLNAGPPAPMLQAPLGQVQAKGAAQASANPLELLQDVQAPILPAANGETAPAAAAAAAAAPAAAAAVAAPAAMPPARPVRTAAAVGRGLKRKQAEEEEEELEKALNMGANGLAAKARDDAHAAKHKIGLKRCLRESQDQEAHPWGQPASQPQLASAATAWAVPNLAAAAQLTANAGAPPAPQLQLPPPFNAPPFAPAPFPLASMPPGLPGQNWLQMAMYQMLLMNNPELMQAHKALGGTVPQMPMESLQQTLTTFAHAAAATDVPTANAVARSLGLWPADGLEAGTAASQTLPPAAPLQSGPLTPAAAAAGPSQSPSLPMTPNLWGAVPPPHARQMPLAWPQTIYAASSGALPPPKSIPVAPAVASAPAQPPPGAAAQLDAAVARSENAASGSEAPAEGSSPADAAPPAAEQEAERIELAAAAETPAADEQDILSGSAAPEEPIEEADAHPPADAQPPSETQNTAADAAAQPAAQPASASEKEDPFVSAELPAAEAVVAAADVKPSPEEGIAEEVEEPKQPEPVEAASAGGHALTTVSNNCPHAPQEADTETVTPDAEPEPTATDAGEAPAAALTAAAAQEPQDNALVPPGGEETQPAPDSQTQLAAEAGAALIGSINEEPTGIPGEGASEPPKEQSQLAADAGAALLGNVQQATAAVDNPPQPPTKAADSGAQEPQETNAAMPDAGEQPASGTAPETEQIGEPPLEAQLAAAVAPTSPPWPKAHSQQQQQQQRLFDPTAALTNGFVAPANGAEKASPLGRPGPAVSAGAVVDASAAAVADPAAPPAMDVGAEAAEAELWGSLLVDSPSPCKAAKPAWAQDPSLWRANAPGPAPPPLGQ